MGTVKWDTAKKYREMRRWIDDNKERIEIDSRHNLSLVAEGAHGAFVGSGDFMLHALMYSYKGLVGLMDGEDAALDYLYQSVYAARADRLFQAAYFYLRRPTSEPSVWFNYAALELARSVVLGCDAASVASATLIWSGLQDGLFYYVNNTRVAPFIIGLYSEFVGLSLPAYPVTPMNDPVYAKLAEVWTTEDTYVIVEALLAACDLHIERARNTTKREVFEFSRGGFDLQPVEILMVLRLREARGLDVPTISHPVMNTAAAKLYTIKSVEPDALIASALTVELARIATLPPHD